MFNVRELRLNYIKYYLQRYGKRTNTGFEFDEKLDDTNPLFIFLSYTYSNGGEFNEQFFIKTTDKKYIPALPSDKTLRKIVVKLQSIEQGN